MSFRFPFWFDTRYLFEDFLLVLKPILLILFCGFVRSLLCNVLLTCNDEMMN